MMFGVSRSQLYDAQKVAQAYWDQVSQEWQDGVQRDHQDKIWEPLDAQVSRTLQAIDQLAILFQQIRQDCE